MDPQTKALTRLTEGTYGERVDAIKEITSLFWLERMAYLAIIVASLLILLAGAIIALVKGQFETTQKIITGGSGGVCAVAVTALLFMWNKSLTLALAMTANDRKRKAALEGNEHHD